MATKADYDAILTRAQNIDLATETLAGHVPTVRAVNFIFDADRNTVFFCTNKDTDKVKEIAANPTVSFATTPDQAGTVRVTGAKATLDNDRKPAILKQLDQKYPSFSMFDADARANMNLYALTYDTADVFYRGSTTLTF